MASKALIDIRNLTKVFKNGRKLAVISDLSLQILENEFFCIIGPTGCGKTTLLRIIAGLEEITSGSVLIDGKAIAGPGEDRGMVFQDFALFPWRSVEKNIEFGLELKGYSEEKRKKISRRLSKLFKLEGFEQSYPSSLSSGMKQRTSIARALANDPKILLMDEPFGSLDAQTRSLMQQELIEIWEKTQKTIVFVTHSIAEAILLGDRVALLTSRPSKLKTLHRIEIPRPRDIVNSKFSEIYRLLRQELESEIDTNFKAERQNLNRQKSLTRITFL